MHSLELGQAGAAALPKRTAERGQSLPHLIAQHRFVWVALDPGGVAILNSNALIHLALIAAGFRWKCIGPWVA